MDYALFSAWKPDEESSRAESFDNSAFHPVDGAPLDFIADMW